MARTFIPVAIAFVVLLAVAVGFFLSSSSPADARETDGLDRLADVSAAPVVDRGLASPIGDEARGWILHQARGWILHEARGWQPFRQEARGWILHQARNTPAQGFEVAMGGHWPTGGYRPGQRPNVHGAPLGSQDDGTVETSGAQTLHPLLS